MSSVGALKKKPQTANPAGRTKKSTDFKVSTKHPFISSVQVDPHMQHMAILHKYK